MKALRSIALAGASLAIFLQIGCASPERTVTGRVHESCFYVSEVNNFKAVDRNTVNFRVGPSDIYEAKLLGSCGDIAWTDAIAFEAKPNSLVCDGLGATLIVPTTTVPRRCPVKSIRKLTPVEVKLLPQGTKP